MYVDVEGARLWVEEDGEGPAVLVPTGAGVEPYRRTFSRQLRMRLHLYFIEMRGTGGSTGTIAGATFASLADDVAAVRGALELPSAVVMGHSNHAAIAIEHGLRHPEATTGVIAIGMSPCWTLGLELGTARWRAEKSKQETADAVAWGDRLRAAADRSHLGEDGWTLVEYFANAAFTWRDPSLARPNFGGVPFGLADYFQWMADALSTWDVRARLRDLRPPLLVVSGRYDYGNPPEAWEDALTDVPGAQHVVLEDSAHVPQAEEPAAFDDIVLGFVANAGSPGSRSGWRDGDRARNTGVDR